MKRAKRKPPMLQILCRDREILYHAPLYHLRLESELINRLSDVYFDDPTPCAIHQNAVLTRIFAELEAALMERGEVVIASLAPQLQEYFSQYPECAYCRLGVEV